MQITSRRKKIAFFIILGVCLVALAVTLNVSWIILNWRKDVLLLLGVIFFAAIILGLILNTGFLVREIRRNEQHDSFINAVTHELKTPIASIPAVPRNTAAPRSGRTPATTVLPINVGGRGPLAWDGGAGVESGGSGVQA